VIEIAKEKSEEFKYKIDALTEIGRLRQVMEEGESEMELEDEEEN
jgi:hypothetical protein